MKKVLIIIYSVVLLACAKEEEFVSAQQQLEIDIVKIEQYLADNNITALSIYNEALDGSDFDTGIRYVIDVEGNSLHPEKDNTVVMKYEGRLMSNEEIFDTTDEEVAKENGLYDETRTYGSIEFPLSGFIPGWQIGIPLFSEGGRGTLYIPSGWAYGKAGSGSIIGKNANLIFDIELLEVK